MALKPGMPCRVTADKDEMMAFVKATNGNVAWTDSIKALLGRIVIVTRRDGDGTSKVAILKSGCKEIEFEKNTGIFVPSSSLTEVSSEEAIADAAARLEAEHQEQEALQLKLESQRAADRARMNEESALLVGRWDYRLEKDEREESETIKLENDGTVEYTTGWSDWSKSIPGADQTLERGAWYLKGKTIHMELRLDTNGSASFVGVKKSELTMSLEAFRNKYVRES